MTKEEIKKTIEEQQKNILKLIEFNCIYRCRGTEIDIENSENKEFFRGMNHAYKELFVKLGDIKYLINAVNINYLDEKELREWEKLKQKIEEKT